MSEYPAPPDEPYLGHVNVGQYLYCHISEIDDYDTVQSPGFDVDSVVYTYLVIGTCEGRAIVMPMLPNSICPYYDTPSAPGGAAAFQSPVYATQDFSRTKKEALQKLLKTEQEYLATVETGIRKMQDLLRKL